MPVISTRYTTTGSSYLPVGTYRSSLSATERSTSLERPNYTSTTESFANRSRQSSTFRSSYSSSYGTSSAASYRLANGISSNDSYSSRYGVSNLSGSSFSASSVRVRPSIDKDLPPSGKTRSESRIRGGDSSVNNSCTQCCTSGTGVNSLCSHHHHYHHTPHTRSSSLARNVALSGLDIYEKYSPANYQTKVELARSRSLSDNPNNHTTTSSTTVNNNISKDISPVAVGIPKVKTRVSNSSINNSNGSNNNICDVSNTNPAQLTKSNLTNNNLTNNNHSSSSTSSSTASVLPSKATNSDTQSHTHHHTHQCKNHKLHNSSPASNTINNLTNNNKQENKQSITNNTTNNNSNNNKSVSQLINAHNQRLQNIERSVEFKKLQGPQGKHVSSNIGKLGTTSDTNVVCGHHHHGNHHISNRNSSLPSVNKQQSANNNSAIMPSSTATTSTTNGFSQGSSTKTAKSSTIQSIKQQLNSSTLPGTSNKSSATTSVFNGNPNKRASFLPAHNSTPSLVGTSSFRDDDFLKKECEIIRNQVISNNQKNLFQDKNNNVNVIDVNGDIISSVKIVNGYNNANSKRSDEKELNEVRNKILNKSNASTITNNMMVNGELVNGTGSGDSIDDIKFIDSDDNLSDKRLSPPSATNLSATPSVTKMLAASTPISSSISSSASNSSNNTNNAAITRKTITLKTNTYPPKHSQSVSPNNKILILNASPKNSCVYEKQQKQQQQSKQSILTNDHHQNISETTTKSTAAPIKSSTMTVTKKNEPTTTVVIGKSRMKVITNETDDEDDLTNVSISATIKLPAKAQNGISTVNHVNEGSDKSKDTDETDATSLSSIFLEKKNLANNKLTDINDSIRNASSIRSALPPSSTLTSRSWDKDSYRSTYSSRNYDNDIGSTTTSSYILPRSSFSSRSGSPGKDYESRKTENTEGLCGLWNIGNTCFMNSVLQCLSNTKELTRSIRTLVPVKGTGKDPRIFTEFQKLIKEIWTPGNRSVNPSEFKMAFSSKHRMYSGSAQQDSQEFLRFFLDSVHGALNTATKAEPITIDDSMSDNRRAELMWNWYSKTENSVIKDLFVGQLKSTLKCTVCENTSVTFDPFWDLSLPLPSNTRCKLSDCLELFIKEEILDGDEMPTCSKCKTRRKCTKSFTIQRFPKILVIHLKRFSETRWSKLTTLVEFPTSEGGLNLAPFTSSSCDSSTASYSLYATSNHMGSTAGGHYVAFCKHPTTKKWHEFNDNSVSDAPESSLVSSSAYLLFYERV